jgi:hypothetical protein
LTLPQQAIPDHLDLDIGAEQRERILRLERIIRASEIDDIYVSDNWSPAGENAAHTGPITNDPSAAIECSFGKAPYMTFSLGGLSTGATGEVLTKDGEVAGGLFAAGRNSCGITRSAIDYANGTCIGDATFLGRLAGHAAAAHPPDG